MQVFHPENFSHVFGFQTAKLRKINGSGHFFISFLHFIKFFRGRLRISNLFHNLAVPCVMSN